MHLPSLKKSAALLPVAAILNACAGGPMTDTRAVSVSGLNPAASHHSITDAPAYKLVNGDWHPKTSSSCASSQVQGGDAGPNASANEGTLFVSNNASTKAPIVEFPGSGKITKPYGTLTDDLSGPYGTYVDGNGTLYVANMADANVLEFKQGKSSPSVTLESNYLSQPMDVAADNKGDVYVVSHNGGPILEFTPGSSNPTQITGFDYPTGLGFDSSLNLYVVDEVYGSAPPIGAVFRLSGSSATNLNLSGLDYPIGITFDSSNDMFVSNLGNNTVTEYAPGSTSPSLTITSGICDPLFMAVNSSNVLFVANVGGNKKGDVTEYASGSTTLLKTLTTDMASTRSVSVNPNLPPPTPSPTPPMATPTPTPTPTPSATPSPKPTKSPKPTPTPKPTKSPKPTPKPTKSPKPTPTP